MPNNPPLQKGALVTSDPLNPPPRTIAFQYNPESLRRTLQPQVVGGEQNDRSQMVRFSGAPTETFTLKGGPVPINADARLEAEADALGARAPRSEPAAGHPSATPGSD
jgi:hypothetical protein